MKHFKPVNATSRLYDCCIINDIRMTWWKNLYVSYFVFHQHLIQSHLLLVLLATLPGCFLQWDCQYLSSNPPASSVVKDILLKHSPRWLDLYWISNSAKLDPDDESVLISHSCYASISHTVHPTDSCRLDLIIPGEQHFYVRGSTPAERQQWLVALGSAKACLTDFKLNQKQGGFKVVTCIRTQRTATGLKACTVMLTHSLEISLLQAWEFSGNFLISGNIVPYSVDFQDVWYVFVHFYILSGSILKIHSYACF